jgi:flavin-dependent dehydrogenase
MYDAIVVGARCAGSPTAMLLARKGYRVLLVDRATFPSDQPMSTHIVWQPGTARLKRWGLLGQVAASKCPALTIATFDLGPFTLAGQLPSAEDTSEAFGPRRTILDKILVDAAVSAGAELRENVTIDELIWENGCVSGASGRSAAGTRVEERAGIVIGADGTHSFVARHVDAAEYHSKAAIQGTYFTYWSGVHLEGVHVFPRPNRQVYALPTNDGLTLVGVNWPMRDFSHVRGDIETQYLDVLGECARDLAAQVAIGQREERWLGGAIPNYFRKPFGPGWALVGDAGYQVDPCTAQGISDAFRDAELLVDALDAGFSERQPLEDALSQYEHRRNDAAMPMYEFTTQLATLAPPAPEQVQLFEALRGNQPQIELFLGVFAGTVPVQEFFAPENIGRIMSSTADTAGPD